MINVDPNNYAAPNTPTSVNSPEYSPACYEIMVQAMKPATHGTQNNTGNIYVVRKGQGTSNRDDTGVIVATVLPGQTLSLVAAALNLNVWSPYRYYLDADNPGDGAFITLIVQ